MLFSAYYAKNYAGIIDASLLDSIVGSRDQTNLLLKVDVIMYKVKLYA